MTVCVLLLLLCIRGGQGWTPSVSTDVQATYFRLTKEVWGQYLNLMYLDFKKKVLYLYL